MTKTKFKEIMDLVKIGFLNGLGWSLGVTVGLAVISTMFLNLGRFGGGLPVVGDFFAAIVLATEEALKSR